jgi:hypothetical protein
MDVGRLSDEQILTITFPHPPNQPRERDATWVVFRQRLFFGAEFPLVRPIVIYSHNIQVARRAAELGM